MRSYRRPGGRTIGVTIVAVTAVVVTLLTMSVVRTSEKATGGSAALPSQSPSAPGSELPPSVGIIGDSTSVGTGDPTGKGWVGRLTTMKCWSVRTSAQGDTGYVTAAQGARPFPERVRDATVSRPQIVIVQGGASDITATSTEITNAARATFVAIRSDAPERKIVVIGPIAAPRYDRTALAKVTAAVRSAAYAERAVFVDPVSYAWLRRDDYATDRTNPDATGYVRYAQRVSDFLLAENLVPNCNDAG